MKEFLHNAQEAAFDSFDRGCEDAKVAHLQWTPSQGNEIKELREELSEDIGTYVKKRQEAKVAELTSSSKERLENSLSKHTSALLAEAGKSKSTSGMWSEIRSVFSSQVQRAHSQLTDEIGMDFDLTDEEMLNLSKSLALHGRATVEKMVKSTKERALELMIMRFREIFKREQKDAPQFHVLTHALTGKLSALGVLSVLSATRLDEEVAGTNIDGIDVDSLSTLVFYPTSFVEIVESFIFSRRPDRQAQHDEALAELSSKSQWRNVTESDTVITPSEFKETWLTFESRISGDIENDVKNGTWWNKNKFAAGFAAGAISTPVAVAAAVINGKKR